MTIWSIWSAPLIMSNDLRNITKTQKEILQNRDVIAIDQDPLGKMGKMILNVSFQVFTGQNFRIIRPKFSGSDKKPIRSKNPSGQKRRFSQRKKKQFSGRKCTCLRETSNASKINQKSKILRKKN